MTYKWMSPTVRNVFCHSRLLLLCPGNNSCRPPPPVYFAALQSKQAGRSKLNGEFFNRRDLHTSMSSLSSNRNQNSSSIKELPCLMNYPTHIIWPSFFKSISNLLAAAIIIKPYFDNEFSLKEFARGAKQALSIISNALSVGDVDSLKELLDKDAFTEIKQNVSQFSKDQLADLAVTDLEEVYLTFPYQVGIIMNDTDRGVQERFVEITVCFHIFKGLSELMKRGDFQPGPSAMQKHRDRIMIGNYRFIREFTKGVNSQWTVNMVHHFRLTDGNY